MRIAQWDILEFIRNPDHVSPDYPEGYFPPPGERASERQWKKSVESFLADRAALEKIVSSRETDFFGAIPHAPGYTILREILLAADHNGYNLGMLNVLLEALGSA